MEMWEFIRRLLAGATGGGQTHSPGLIAGIYYRDLQAQNMDTRHPWHEFSDLGDLFTEDLLEAELIRPAGVRNGSAAILGAMERTELGEELHGALCQRGVVQFFESMQAEVEPGVIRRLLHQLNS